MVWIVNSVLLKLMSSSTKNVTVYMVIALIMMLIINVENVQMVSFPIKISVSTIILSVSHMAPTKYVHWLQKVGLSVVECPLSNNNTTKLSSLLDKMLPQALAQLL
jgi:hypothetical protein